MDFTTPEGPDSLVYNVGNPDSVITTAILRQTLKKDPTLVPTHKLTGSIGKNVFCPNLLTSKKNAMSKTVLERHLCIETDDYSINSALSILTLPHTNINLKVTDSSVMLRLALALSKLNDHVKNISTEEMALIWHNHNIAIKSVAQRHFFHPVDVLSDKEHIANWGRNPLSEIREVPEIKEYLNFIEDLKFKLCDITVYETHLMGSRDQIPVIYADAFTSPFRIKLMMNVFNCALVVRVYGNVLYGDFQARQGCRVTWRVIEKIFNGDIVNANVY